MRVQLAVAGLYERLLGAAEGLWVHVPISLSFINIVASGP